MAYYLVSAELKKEFLEELKKEIKRKAFIKLQPFGKALTYSLENSRITNDKIIWEEEDYCFPPLKEEKTVLERYFTNIQVMKVEQGEGWEKINDFPRFLQPGKG